MRLDAEGRLWHDDELVENARVARAFRQGIERDPSGRYLIRFGWDWCVLAVEDAPFQALGVRSEAGQLILALDDGREVSVGGDALRSSAAGVLYARFPGRGGELEARLSRAAQGQLVPLLDEREGQAFVRLGEKEYELRAR
jgi:hypothetical protein